MGTDPKVADSTVTKLVLGVIAFTKQELGRKNVDVEVLRAAWLTLKENRGTTEHAGNIDIAAAEHYLFAAYLAAATGDPTVSLSPVVYETKKRLYFFLGLEERMRTDPRFPVVPPSSDVEAWGIAGAQYGIEVFKQLHPRESLKYGAAIGSLAKDAGYGETSSTYAGKAATKFGSLLNKFL